jgi:hypothetical protein
MADYGCSNTSHHHRLFVGSRIKSHTGEFCGGHQYEPGKLVVINTETGKAGNHSTMLAVPMTPFIMTQEQNASTARDDE